MGSRLSWSYGFVLKTMCGPVFVAVAIFGRWRANPGGYIRQRIGIGIDWLSYVGILNHGRIDLFQFVD